MGSGVTFKAVTPQRRVNGSFLLRIRMNVEIGSLFFFFFPSVCLYFPDASSQALTLYFNGEYSPSFCCCFLVFKFSLCLFSQQHMACVFLDHRSSWLKLLTLEEFPAVHWVWLMMARTQVIDWQTSSILESLEATPPAALVVRSWDSSNFGSSSCLSSSSSFLTKVWRLNLGQVCPICQPCRLVLRNRYKVKNVPYGNMLYIHCMLCKWGLCPSRGRDFSILMR